MKPFDKKEYLKRLDSCYTYARSKGLKWNDFKNIISDSTEDYFKELQGKEPEKHSQAAEALKLF